MVQGCYVPVCNVLVCYVSVCYVPVCFVSVRYVPEIFVSLYISSLNESQPRELHQPRIGWAFSLT
jgi:hypothetical protein